MLATITLAFFIALGLASLLGWTVDSRDGAGWAPNREPDRDALWNRDASRPSGRGSLRARHKGLDQLDHGDAEENPTGDLLA